MGKFQRKRFQLILLSLGLFLIIWVWFEIHIARDKNDVVHSKAPEEERKPKETVTLFIAVLNKVTNSDRRNAVRTTWMSLCESYNRQVACKFFTDSLEDLPKVERGKIEQESRENKDMLFVPIKGTVNFSLRLIWMMTWATKNYQFDFFLRVDDDHFLCLDRLIGEIQYRPKNSLYWGFIHCYPKIVRVDEGWMMLTRDLVEEALSKLNSTLPCHPYGDQAVAVWMLDSNYNVTYFYDNDRIEHSATAYQESKFLSPHMCEKYLSLHGSYPSTMRKYWNATQRNQPKVLQYQVLGIPRFEERCRHSNKIFDVNSFGPPYRHKLKPCRDLPTWTKVDEFQSREKTQREISNAKKS